jgi:hypothetical protein
MTQSSGHGTRGGSVVRGTKKLLLKMSLVGLGYIGILFVVYGIKIRFFFMTDAWKDIAFQVFLLSSPVIPLFLYYLLVLRSNLLSTHLRRRKAMAISIAATVISLYCGMLLCLNTFGS